MLAVMVRFKAAAVPCWRTKVQLAVLMLLASWLKGSGVDVAFSKEMAKWPGSIFWHMLKSFGNVASGLYFALPLPLPLPLLAGVLPAGLEVPLAWLVYQRTPTAPRPRTSRTATVLATISTVFAGRAWVRRPLCGSQP